MDKIKNQVVNLRGNLFRNRKKFLLCLICLVVCIFDINKCFGKTLWVFNPVGYFNESTSSDISTINLNISVNVSSDVTTQSYTWDLGFNMKNTARIGEYFAMFVFLPNNLDLSQTTIQVVDNDPMLADKEIQKKTTLDKFLESTKGSPNWDNISNNMNKFYSFKYGDSNFEKAWEMVFRDVKNDEESTKDFLAEIEKWKQNQMFEYGIFIVTRANQEKDKKLIGDKNWIIEGKFKDEIYMNDEEIPILISQNRGKKSANYPNVTLEGAVMGPHDLDKDGCSNYREKNFYPSKSGYAPGYQNIYPKLHDKYTVEWNKNNVRDIDPGFEKLNIAGKEVIIYRYAINDGEEFINSDDILNALEVRSKKIEDKALRPLIRGSEKKEIEEYINKSGNVRSNEGYYIDGEGRFYLRNMPIEVMDFVTAKEKKSSENIPTYVSKTNENSILENLKISTRYKRLDKNIFISGIYGNQKYSNLISVEPIEFNMYVLPRKIDAFLKDRKTQDKDSEILYFWAIGVDVTKPKIDIEATKKSLNLKLTDLHQEEFNSLTANLDANKIVAEDNYSNTDKLTKEFKIFEEDNEVKLENFERGKKYILKAFVTDEAHNIAEEVIAEITTEIESSVKPTVRQIRNINNNPALEVNAPKDSDLIIKLNGEIIDTEAKIEWNEETKSYVVELPNNIQNGALVSVSITEKGKNPTESEKISIDREPPSKKPVVEENETGDIKIEVEDVFGVLITINGEEKFVEITNEDRLQGLTIPINSNSKPMNIEVKYADEFLNYGESSVLEIIDSAELEPSIEIIDSAELEPSIEVRDSTELIPTERIEDNFRDNIASIDFRDLKPSSKVEEIKETKEAEKKILYPKYVFGYSDGTVRAEEFVTRAEVAAIIIRLKDKNYVDEKDLGSKSKWYDKYIEKAMKNGYMRGYPDGTFKPDRYMTRAEFIYVLGKLQNLGSETKKFSDIDGHWAENEIGNAYSRGILNGYEDGSFKPENNITRAEIMAIINRLQGRTSNENLKEISFKDLKGDEWYYQDIQLAAQDM